MAAIVAVVISMSPALIIPVLATVVIPSVTMLFLITWNVLAVVPVVPDKQDSLAAGVVFAAVLAPMLGVARRYAHIDWRAIHRYAPDCYRLTIKHSRLRIAADIKLAIEAGLPNAERDANVGSKRRRVERGNGGSGYCRCDQKTFHACPFFGEVSGINNPLFFRRCLYAGTHRTKWKMGCELAIEARSRAVWEEPARCRFFQINGYYVC